MITPATMYMYIRATLGEWCDRSLWRDTVIYPFVCQVGQFFLSAMEAMESFVESFWKPNLSNLSYISREASVSDDNYNAASRTESTWNLAIDFAKLKN